MSVIARLPLGAALAMLMGCYAYQPMSTLVPRVGARVEAELSGSGMDTLAGYVGPGVMKLRGDVVGAESTEVILAVTAVTDRNGLDQFWKGERVRLPHGAVQSVRQRKFSLGRSVLIATALLGGSVGAWQVFQGGNRGGALPPGRGGSRPQ